MSDHDGVAGDGQTARTADDAEGDEFAAMRNVQALVIG
jgi:hypothetical protein